MTRTKSTCLAVLAVLLSPMAANAVPIVIGATELTGSDGFEDFESLALQDNFNGTLASGISISTISGSGAGIISTNPCDNSFYGVSDNYLYVGVDLPCNVLTQSSDGISIAFNGDITDLSWVGFVVSHTNTVTFDRLLNGVVVETDVFNNAGFVGGPFLLSGTVFDELRIQETGCCNGLVPMDNLRWNYASVPEPGTLALFGIGLFGMGLARRKKKL